MHEKNGSLPVSVDPPQVPRTWDRGLGGIKGQGAVFQGPGRRESNGRDKARSAARSRVGAADAAPAVGVAQVAENNR